MNQVLSSICPHLHLNGLVLIYTFWQTNISLKARKPSFEPIKLPLKLLRSNLCEQLNGEASIYFIPEKVCYFAKKKSSSFKAGVRVLVQACASSAPHSSQMTHLTFEILLFPRVFSQIFQAASSLQVLNSSALPCG